MVDVYQIVQVDMVKEPLDIKEEEGHGEPGRHSGTGGVNNGGDSICGTVVVLRTKLR
jgi:hypothetical protein